MWDHPREYGENGGVDKRKRLSLGSSPRIRGECSLPAPGNPSGRIIPANTGRMCTHITPAVVEWDHPREYGENYTKLEGPLSKAGSSPRIRGESTKLLNNVNKAGIIPANTGRILGKDAPTETGRDHPREYGENQRTCRRRRGRWGSSPRIRGEFAH